MDGDALLAGRGIDLSAVFRTSQPTRDVLVTRSLDGDRTFAGFGKAKANGVVFNCFPSHNACQLPGTAVHWLMQHWLVQLRSGLAHWNFERRLRDMQSMQTASSTRRSCRWRPWSRRTSW